MQLPGKPLDRKDSILAVRGKPVPAELPQPPDESVPTPVKNGKSESGDKPVSFVPRKPMYSFDQVILPESIRLQFQTLKSRIANHRLLYEDWELDKIDPQGKHIAFNLYGVPGSGVRLTFTAIV
jgi:hypothetical protein